MAPTLDHVENSIAKREAVVFGSPKVPFRVTLVNFAPRLPYPRAYVYSSCTTRLPNGRICGTSVDKRRGRCEHRDARSLGNVSDSYRVHVALTDSSVTKPVVAVVFDEMEQLLNWSASDFAALTEGEQNAIMHDIVRQFPRLNVVIKVREGQNREFEAVVSRVDLMEKHYAPPSVPTPGKKFVTSASADCRGLGEGSSISPARYFEAAGSALADESDCDSPLPTPISAKSVLLEELRESVADIAAKLRNLT